MNLRKRRPRSVGGAESGGDDDLSSNGSGTSEYSGSVPEMGATILHKLEDEEAIESEGEDEPDILPESHNQHPKSLPADRQGKSSNGRVDLAALRTSVSLFDVTCRRLIILFVR